MWKKALFLGVTLLLMCGMVLGCAQKTDANVGVPNPVIDSDAAGVLAETGVSFAIPEGASEVAYSLIDMGADQSKLGQVTFQYEGNQYNCRVQQGNAESDISGMYFNEKSMTEESFPMDRVEAKLFTDGSGMGALRWYDALMGLNFSVSVSEKADKDALISVAEPIVAALTQEAG